MRLIEGAEHKRIVRKTYADTLAIYCPVADMLLIRNQISMRHTDNFFAKVFCMIFGQNNLICHNIIYKSRAGGSGKSQPIDLNRRGFERTDRHRKFIFRVSGEIDQNIHAIFINPPGCLSITHAAQIRELIAGLLNALPIFAAIVLPPRIADNLKSLPIM